MSAVQLASEFYRKGRNDFLQSIVETLSTPEMQNVVLTVPDFVKVLKDCGEKCDAVAVPPIPPPK